MPYRRLPNTDKARLRALSSAYENSRRMDVKDLAYDFSTKLKIESFLPKFEITVKNQRSARNQQATESKNYNQLVKKARLYVSHFIQVYNFCILRGEIKKETRELYGLDIDCKSVPNLTSEADLIEWGKKIIDGEQERIRSGGTAIYSPSIALVRVNYDKFKQAYYSQKQLQTNTSRLNEEVAKYRKEADEIILNLWNQIESHFSNIGNENKKREACENYGIKYVFRKGELERIRKREEAEKITMRLDF